MTELHGLFVGLTTYDVIHYVHDFPGADEKVQASGRWQGAGGPAANAAGAFSALGGRATLLTAVGPGPFGAAARADLEREAVAVVDLADEGEIAMSAITVDSAGRRSVVSVNAAGFDHAELLRRVEVLELDRPHVVVFDSHYPAVVNAVVARLPRSTPAIFDPGTAKAKAAGLLSLASHTIASQSFRPDRSPRQILDLLDGATQLVAVTQGGGTILARETGADYAVRVPPASVVDTLGAGDVLHGSFAFHITHGMTVRAALEAAASDATRSCERRGPRLRFDP